MSAATKLLKAAAGNAGGSAVYVDDVYSTFLYDGTGSSQTINNGIDLSGEGGLVWIKRRSSARDHGLFDTERGVNQRLYSNYNLASGTNASSLTAFNSNGFTVGTESDVNGSSTTNVAWTFRKQEKFFDIVTYTGNGSSGRAIAHNLGSTPGMIIVKRTDSSSSLGWAVFHRSSNNLMLNSAGAANDNFNGDISSVTDSSFTVSSYSDVNASSGTFVAYLFAHDEQDFGEDSDEAIIKCGSFSGTGQVDLGFEPQWIMYKPYSQSWDWEIADNIRGLDAVSSSVRKLEPNTSDAEAGGSDIKINATGFYNGTFGASYPCIYVAIRRPHKPASEFAATDLFKPNSNDNGGGKPDIISGFPVDFYFRRYRNSDGHNQVLSRLQGTRLLSTSNNDPESSTSYDSAGFDYNNGVMNIFSSTNSNYGAWMWRRAKGFCDVVAYAGNSVSGRTLTHGLKVIPELIICKARTDTWDWVAYTAPTGGGYYLKINDTQAATASSGVFPSSPTASVFTLASGSFVNRAGEDYIAYLFASVAGVSKIGSYTGTGSDLNVDCGFSSGARFVLVKRTDDSGDWYYWDSVRGIVAGDDAYLLLNSASAEVTNTDYIDPLSSGFTITSSAPAALNNNGGTYFFYAIA